MTAASPLTNVQARDAEALLHPYTPLHRLKEIGPLVIQRAKGIYVYDTQGKPYIEGMAGLWCTGLGYGDEEMIEAATEQMRTLSYSHLFGAKGMEPAIELAEKLKEIAPVPISKVFYTSSGSEANDTQVKLAWYMNNALGRPNKKKMGAGGVIVPPAGYYPAIQQVLDEHDIIMIDDEVINGFGRTGNWWGAQTLGMRPTTISAAKQLTSAYAPLGAVMIPEDIYQAYVDHSRQIGTFGHGFTYGGHPLGCALGVKAIEIYQRRDIIGHVRALSPVFEARMRKLAGNPLVGEARYCGLVGGVELVADRAAKRSFDAARGVGPQLTKFLEGRGAILRAIGDTIAICPPMIITEAELNELFDRLELALADTESWVAKEGLRAAA